jgi:pimeloyl-ACP methyl ester carboxylesterase/DNA-binding CsgD family transcriptional regulator
VVATEISDNSLSASRAGVIEKIYELVLAPDSYDDFMEDWDRHISAQVERLHELRDTSQQFDDPVLEAHFNRALAIFERLGRTPQHDKDESDDAGNAGAIVRRDGSMQVEPGTFAGIDDVTQFEDLAPLLDTDGWSRLFEAFASLRHAPRVGKVLVLALEGAGPEGTATAFYSAATVRDRQSGEIVLRIQPLTVSWPPEFDGLLKRSFKLTAAEIRLVQALADGQSLNQLSRSGGRSMNTLRSQLKSVFQKTRTGSQADLVRLVGTFSSFSDTLQAGKSVSPQALHTGRVENVILPGGRNMPVHLLGPEDGIPVIFFHGMLDGVAITSRIHHLLDHFHIRLIAPVRPNFGQASQDFRIRLAPQIFADDISILVERMGIARCLAVGHMAGSVYAFAAASGAAAQAVRGVISISGGVPIKSIRQFSLMTPRQRTVAYTARFMPTLLPAILRAGIAQIDSTQPEAFMNALYATGSPDRHLVRDPDIASAIMDGYRFAVAQGHRAFQTDSYHVTRDWSQQVEGSDCPVMVLHGAHDPVVNISTVRSFVRSLGHRAELREFADSGQLLFHQQPEQALKSVVEFWESLA